MLSSCSSEDEVTQTVDDAGTFIVTNLSYDEGNDNLNVNALKGDTLKVIFSPKKDYKDLKFVLDCQELKKLNDSLFVVTDSKAGRYQHSLSAKYEAKTESTNISYSANNILTVNIPEAYVIIPYKVSISNDLLGFVDAELSYTDADGNDHTCVISDNQWVRSDSVRCQLWEDAKGGLHFVEVEKDHAEEGWTLVEERMELPYIYYDFIVRYYNVGISTNVIVRYKQKESMSFDRDSYDFYHKLKRGKADVHIPNLIYIDNSFSFDLTINIGGDNLLKKDKVKDYIDELVKTPDVIKLRIDPADGVIKEEK